jgi:hypothetical protein
VAKTRRKAQLRGQNLPAKSKNNKVKARDLSAYIVDWADLSEEQRKELDSTSWGPRAPDSDEDEDINEPDSDESMSGNPAAGGSGGADHQEVEADHQEEVEEVAAVDYHPLSPLPCPL